MVVLRLPLNNIRQTGSLLDKLNVSCNLKEETDTVRRKTMKISLVTDIGQRRSNNQDFINKFDNKKGITLVILADGMGGHRAGNIASEMTVTDLGREWISTEFTELSQIRDWLITALEAENQRIYELGQTDEYKGMGTTVEALAIVDNNVIFAHVGDSRIGLLHNGEYELLTSDHSLVNELVKAGQLTEEEAANHPQKNIITQSIGQANPVEPDLGVQVLEEDDYLIINSDGLTNMITNDEIVSILSQDKNLDDKNNELVTLANERGVLIISPLLLSTPKVRKLNDSDWQIICWSLSDPQVYRTGWNGRCLSCQRSNS